MIRIDLDFPADKREHPMFLSTLAMSRDVRFILT